MHEQNTDKLIRMYSRCPRMCGSENAVNKYGAFSQVLFMVFKGEFVCFILCDKPVYKIFKPSPNLKFIISGIKIWNKHDEKRKKRNGYSSKIPLTLNNQTSTRNLINKRRKAKQDEKSSQQLYSLYLLIIQ